MFFLPKSKIASRLVIYVLMFSTVVTLLLTLVQLFRDYNYDISLIETKFIEIEFINKPVLEDNLWLLNNGSINLLMDGILRHEDIAYLEINDGSDVLFSKGIMPNGDYKEAQFKLYYTYRDRTHFLGNFKIVATLEYVYSRLLETTLIILVTQAIKTFLVSIFIMLIVWNLVTKHLNTIKDYALEIQLENHQDDLTLNRGNNKWTKDDEFSLLIKGINRMRKNLFVSYSKIEHQSLHDPLTRLPNRRLMEDRLKHELIQSERQQLFGAVLFIDVDHFKLINDSLGHVVGDKILIEVSKRLINVTRKGDTISRIGGDEFIIILSLLSRVDSDATREAKNIAHKVLFSLNEKFNIGDQQLNMSASIGITLFMGGSENCETVLKNADNAMYQAKENGRNQVSLFHSKMQDVADERLKIEQMLHEAIKNNQFSLNYQPKYNQSKIMRSAEVLIRWRQANGEFIPPDKFIPIAEDSGLIIKIGYQVITMAFQQMSDAKDLIEHSSLKSIAINISPKQFQEQGFAENVISMVDEFELDPSLFILEVTEETFVSHVDKTIKTMNALKQHGFKLSIDDFGTGYSSLRYLKHFPLDELKIDKSFIDEIVSNEDDIAIVRTIISMAKNLKLDVVAEGVETEEQFQLLSKNDCQLFQGYLLSKPLEYQSFLSLITVDVQR